MSGLGLCMWGLQKLRQACAASARNATSGKLRGSVGENFAMNAVIPTFPLVRMKVVEDASSEAAPVELRVNPGVRALLASLIPGDDILLCVAAGDKIEWFTQDVTTTLKVLTSLGIVRNVDVWIQESHNSMARIAESQNVDAELDDDEALAASEYVLDTIGLLKHVKNQRFLFTIAATALNNKTMDANTLISRLAISIYHYTDVAGRPVRKILDNPSAAYASMLDSKIGTNLRPINDLHGIQKTSAVQLIVCFAIASFVYRTLRTE